MYCVYNGRSPNLIVGDGNGYYSWLRSAWIDNDINFKNDYKYLFSNPDLPELNRKTPAGNIVNKYPIGMAIIEIPGFAFAHFISKPLGYSRDGVSLPYQFSVVLFLSFFILISFVFLLEALLVFGANPFVAFILCAVALSGTNLVHYISKDVSMAHGAGVALLNFLAYISAQIRKNKKFSPTLCFLAGLLVGLLLIVRYTNIAMTPFLIFLVFDKNFTHKRIVIFLIGCLTMVGLQLLASYELWGNFIIDTYHDETFSAGLPGLIKVLFSEKHGLFIYHPWYAILLIINLYGTIFIKEHRKFNIVALLSFLALWIINGLWWCWWFGASFGNRAFVEILIPLTFGAALTLTNSPAFMKSKLKRFIAATLTITFFNVYLWAGFNLIRYDPCGEHSISDAYFWITHSRVEHPCGS